VALDEIVVESRRLYGFKAPSKAEVNVGGNAIINVITGVPRAPNEPGNDGVPAWCGSWAEWDDGRIATEKKTSPPGTWGWWGITMTGRALSEMRPVPRRGLSRDESAMYIGISDGKFDELVADGRMPTPVKIDGRKVWDLRALDLAFDALVSESSSPNSWDGVAMRGSPWRRSGCDSWTNTSTGMVRFVDTSAVPVPGLWSFWGFRVR
jgi:predicted DNA-binding transcriptional regulator AlpA